VPGRRPRIVIVNAFADDNRGGAALTQAAVDVARAIAPGGADVFIVPVRETTAGAFRHLRRANDVTVLGPLVHPRAGRCGTVVALAASALMLAGLRTSFGGARPTTYRALRDADLVISRGGVIFAQRNAGPGDLARLWFAALPCIVAGRFRRPLVFVGAQVGPVMSRAGRGILRMALGRARFVWARGPRSRHAARRLVGRRTTLVQAPDSVFLLEPPPARHEPRGVVIVPGGDTGLGGAAIPAIATWVRREQESAPRILRQVDGDQNSDWRWLEQLRSSLGDLELETVDHDLDVDGYLGELGRAELVVSTRMHSVLLSVLAGTPAVAVFIGDEYRKLDALEGIGLPELATQPDALARAVERVRAISTDELAARSVALRGAASNAVEQLRTALGTGPWSSRDHAPTRRDATQSDAAQGDASQDETTSRQ
jgi:polysaccharide pyruvyl transferase WcaK-like protein